MRDIPGKDSGARDLRWSPDSKWLAYSVPVANGLYQIALLHLETGENVPITSDRCDSYSAIWSRDGAWLYFLSDPGSVWGSS